MELLQKLSDEGRSAQHFRLLNNTIIDIRSCRKSWATMILIWVRVARKPIDGSKADCLARIVDNALNSTIYTCRYSQYAARKDRPNSRCQSSLNRISQLRTWWRKSIVRTGSFEWNTEFRRRPSVQVRKVPRVSSSVWGPSTPYYPQSNSIAENVVTSVKHLLSKIGLY